jgi:hypothetical protein
MPQNMPYPKGNASMKNGKSMSEMMGVGKGENKQMPPMKGKKSMPMKGKKYMSKGSSC